MSFYRDYKKRMLGNANSVKEKEIDDLKWHFENVVLKTLPSAQKVQISGPEEYTITENTAWHEVVIEDITNNDKKALDEKNLYVKVDANVDVGCYVFFDNCFWLIQFKEHKTIADKKHFTMRRCNQFVNYRYFGRIYKIPVSIENLTMYSDGIYDGVYISTEDAKRQVWCGSNPITRTLVTGTRIMLTHNSVFKITHINDFEYTRAETGDDGLLKLLVAQTGVLKEDDLENEIAYNDDSGNDSDIYNSKEIKGKEYVNLGSTNTYECSTDCKIRLKTNYEYIRLSYIDDGKYEVKVAKNIEFINKKFTLQLLNKDNSLMKEKEISIRG